MDHPDSFPTSADYAMDTARTYQERLRGLSLRIEVLEEVVGNLLKALGNFGQLCERESAGIRHQSDTPKEHSRSSRNADCNFNTQKERSNNISREIRSINAILDSPEFVACGPDNPDYVLGFRAGILLAIHYLRGMEHNVAAALLTSRWPYVFNGDAAE